MRGYLPEPDIGTLTRVHPLIRILSLLVFIVLMALGGLSSLVIGGCLLVLLYTVSGMTPVHGLWRVVRRIRWLLLSILLLYGWWTPGTPLLTELGAYAPSLEGLVQGGVRAGLLVAIVGAVHWVMTTTHRPELLGAVVALTSPLQRLGVAHERLAVRILLTLETVPQVQRVAAEAAREPLGRVSRLASVSHRARTLYGRILAQADSAELRAREVQMIGRVPRWQWGVPVFVALLLWLGRWSTGLLGLA